MPSVVAASDYGVVNVRVRARRADMLATETWNRLHSAQGFDALLTMLGDTAYGPYLQIAHEQLTPRRAAYQVRKQLADAYQVVIDSVPESGRGFVVHLRRLFEVDNLKAVLRGVPDRRGHRGCGMGRGDEIDIVTSAGLQIQHHPAEFLD